jgi:hypothetical protein
LIADANAKREERLKRKQRLCEESHTGVRKMASKAMWEVDPETRSKVHLPSPRSLLLNQSHQIVKE